MSRGTRVGYLAMMLKTIEKHINSVHRRNRGDLAGLSGTRKRDFAVRCQDGLVGGLMGWEESGSLITARQVSRDGGKIYNIIICPIDESLGIIKERYSILVGSDATTYQRTLRSDRAAGCDRGIERGARTRRRAGRSRLTGRSPRSATGEDAAWAVRYGLETGVESSEAMRGSVTTGC